MLMLEGSWQKDWASGTAHKGVVKWDRVRALRNQGFGPSQVGLRDLETDKVDIIDKREGKGAEQSRAEQSGAERSRVLQCSEIALAL